MHLDDFWAEVDKAAAAKYGDSNDAEIDALWGAVELACHLLGEGQRLTQILDANDPDAE